MENESWRFSKLIWHYTVLSFQRRYKGNFWNFWTSENIPSMCSRQVATDLMVGCKVHWLLHQNETVVTCPIRIREHLDELRKWVYFLIWPSGHSLPHPVVVVIVSSVSGRELEWHHQGTGTGTGGLWLEANWLWIRILTHWLPEEGGCSILIITDIFAMFQGQNKVMVMVLIPRQRRFDSCTVYD